MTTLWPFSSLVKLFIINSIKIMLPKGKTFHPHFSSYPIDSDSTSIQYANGSSITESDKYMHHSICYVETYNYIMATEKKGEVSEVKAEDCYDTFAKNSYPLWKLIWEGIYLSFSIVLWLFLIKETVERHTNPLPTVLGFIISQFVVDYVSGFVHWAGDTWGTLKTPIFGTALIGPFRLHHVDPQDICVHSWMETNAASSYPMPFFITACLMFSSGTFLSQTCNWAIVFGVPLGILTNQCHKWAHMVHTKPHKIVRFLQQAGYIISPEKHLLHHQGQFDKAYCIVNGWMNPILDYFNHWKAMERLFHKLSGAIPREDDAYWREVNLKYKEKEKVKAK